MALNLQNRRFTTPKLRNTSINWKQLTKSGKSNNKT